MPLHIVFAGTPDLAVPVLQALIDDPAFEVDLVITQPDRPVGRQKIITASPVKVLAEKNGIPVWQPENIKKEFDQRPQTSDQRPDFLIAIAYGQILSQEVLDWPSVAPVNVHVSLLPRWRGASPIQHAILHGDATSGVTVQRMVHTLDAGPILSSKSTPLDPRETASSLHDRLSLLAADLLPETLKKPLTETEQDEANVTKCGLLDRSKGEVDTKKMTADEIDRHVRALNPWPGVTCEIDGDTVKILETSLKTSDNAVRIDCANDTTLFVMSLQPPGKRRMTGKEWVHGRQNYEADGN